MEKYTFKLVNVNEGIRTIDYIGDIQKKDNNIVIKMKDSTISMDINDDCLYLLRTAEGVKTEIRANQLNGEIKITTDEGELEFDIRVTKFKRHNENLVMVYELNDNTFQLLFGRVKTYGN